MPRIYTYQEKCHALWLLQQLDSVDAVSLQLNIPERTLRDWVRARRRGELTAHKDPATNFHGKPGTITITEIRDRMLAQIDTLTRQPAEDPRKAYFASLAVDRILAQIKYLNDALGISVLEEPN